MYRLIPLAAVLGFAAMPAYGQKAFTVALQPVADEKAVFATVESRKVIPARARIGGKISELTGKIGDEVTKGQQIALVTDEKLQLQIQSLDAQIVGLKSQLEQATTVMARIDTLATTGVASRQQVDQSHTAVDVAKSALAARTAERAVVAQQVSEGAVLAPASGRVLQVPLIAGSVVLPGEQIASVAEADFVLRLSVPERHARFLHSGDKVRLDGADLGAKGAVFGTIVLVYPQVQDGRVLADASAPGIGQYFVGQRIRVWVMAGDRSSYVIPAAFIHSRFGLSYVNLRDGDGPALEVPIQKGRDMPTPERPDGVEILSGLRAGDILVAP